MEHEPAVRVKATKRTFDIVEAIKEMDGATVSALAEVVDRPKSTVHDHLSTLQELEFVVKEGDTYRLGTRFLEYGGYIRENMEVFHVARPEVKRLAEDTGEHANLMVREHNLGVFLYRARGEEAVTLDTHPGMRVHLHTTSMGKAILAHLPEETVRDIVDQRGLPAVTSNTITDEATLFEELRRTREQGYAVDDEERVSGMRCVAAPILDGDGEAVAAISISAPTSRLNGERFEASVPELVQRAANVVEVNMTFA